MAAAGVPAVVAINAFPDDHPSEHAVIRTFAERCGVACAVSTHVADGGAGALALAEAVWAASEPEPASESAYEATFCFASWGKYFFWIAGEAP